MLCRTLFDFSDTEERKDPRYGGRAKEFLGECFVAYIKRGMRWYLFLVRVSSDSLSLLAISLNIPTPGMELEKINKFISFINNIRK